MAKRSFVAAVGMRGDTGHVDSGVIMQHHDGRVPFLFLLSRPGPNAATAARDVLQEMGVRIDVIDGHHALIGRARQDECDVAADTGLFALVTRSMVGRETLAKLGEVSDEFGRIVTAWNFRLSSRYRKIAKDDSDQGVSWGDPERGGHRPDTMYASEDFKALLAEHLGADDPGELLERFGGKVARELIERFGGKDRWSPETSAELERLFIDRYLKEAEDEATAETAAYYMTRMALVLEVEWLPVLYLIPWEVIVVILLEPACWRMEGEISVGVVFVESSRADGPKFSSSERNTLVARITDGFSFLSNQAPTAASLTWMFDWQFVTIDVANGNNNSDEAYWRDPAMAEVQYNGNTYAAQWSSVAEYREDMRQANWSRHAFVIFVTPYGTDWHAYAGSKRVTMANRNNWGGWGINAIDEITVHEVCHLFGASDEYTGSGTPCSSCGGAFGCGSLPNGNCAACAEPHQSCIMDQNTRRMCEWTQGHVGWSDLFVELFTADTGSAGTDDTVWLDIGDRTFVLDTPSHDDRERDNREGYALHYTGVTKPDIKRVGIRKSPDGWFGGWKLERVKVWCRGELICNAYVNQWLEDEYRWWASLTCGSSSTIVNRLRVVVHTADVWWAGTDDTVTFSMGGRSWGLDNPNHNDFERGNVDTFHLDPGTGLYESMLGSIRIHKSPDGLAGGWKLKGLEIYVNNTRVYRNLSINTWLEDGDRDWYGSI